MRPIKISVVVPIYNEVELVDDLYARLIKVLQNITSDFEIICVDDGSTDGSLDRLIDYHKKDNRFKVLILSKNFGHQAAYTAGLKYAKGDFVAMMDGDLQDPPELLALMYEKLQNESLDVVYGKRIKRDEPIIKKSLINLFHFVYNYIVKLKEVDNVGNFSIFSRRVSDSMLSLNEKNRYLPGLRSFIGFEQEMFEYQRKDRLKGTPKMNFNKLLRLALDAVFSFSNLPIKICLYAGLSGVVLFFFGLSYSFISKMIGISPTGWSSIILSIYFIGSVQLLFLGILGEYIFRIYVESQNRPLYFIDRFVE